MPSYTDPAFPEACKALSRHRLVRKALRQAFQEKTNLILRHLREGVPLPAELEEAYDVLICALDDDSPVVKVYEAEQDKGVYNVTIRGFSGAYFIQATEYDDSEIFLTKAEAEEHAFRYFGEFM
jgi:hypothetical protein